MKKYLLSFLFAASLLVLPAAAADLFPVDSTATSGFTSWGYMDENGAMALPYQYATASAFYEDGLAVVTDRGGNTAVIDAAGAQVVPFRAPPSRVEIEGGIIAFRYQSKTLFFDKTGAEIGAFSTTSGFFSEEEGLLAVEQEGRWGYANRAGEMVIPTQYLEAGTFSDGHAVVRLSQDDYAVIDAAGFPDPLPAGAAPKYLEIYGGDLVVLTNRSRAAVYSYERGAMLTDFIYQEISPYRDGYAMMRINNRWGITNLRGDVTLAFDYNYLSYMGEGVYAARGSTGAVSAIDAEGNLIYRTPMYAGGFQTISHGLSWHGTAENSVIFFSKVGGYVTSLKNAENPTVLTENVVLVTIGGKRQYVRLADGKTLYSPARTYDMDYFKITTASYEKYLGMRADGTEYGWSLTYPVVSGLADKAVQTKVNSAIETFFLEGPSFSAQRQPLTGSYGLRTEGRLLIVWADCISGAGDGAAIWNDNITLDLATGARYQVVPDLFVKNYKDTVMSLLPSGTPYYLFSYPRITENGVSFYLNTPQSGNRAPATKAYLLTFAQLGSVINEAAPVWSALNGTAIDALKNYVGYKDVSKLHWAYDAIKTVIQREIMQGDGVNFHPESPITTAEAASVLVRALEIDVSQISPPQGAPWYYIEATAADKAGLTTGFAAPIAYTADQSRADAMQMVANALVKTGTKPLAAEEITARLAAFSDAGAVPENRRAAFALCVREGLVVGNGGKLNPADPFTRAQFAQILSRTQIGASENVQEKN